MLVEDLLFGRPYHEKLVDIIKDMVNNVIKDNDMLLHEINDWEISEKRNLMILGERYYRNRTDLRATKKQDLSWKSNLKLEHGFLKKLVDQKTGYLLTKQPTIATENDSYKEVLEDVFDKKMLKKLKNVGKEAINKGIAYLYVFFDEEGNLGFKKFPSEQILPFWKDDEHTEVLSFVRSYSESIYMNGKKVIQKKVEYHHEDGINYFILESGKLIPDVPMGIKRNYHFTINDAPTLWNRIPLIPFKYNEEEQPLVDSIKSLVDNYNLQASTNADLLADIPNFIYKLVNYEGQSLEEFNMNLRRYRTIKVGENGDIDKLQAESSTESMEKELDRDRKSIYEFGRGVDTTNSELGNASGVALRYRYSDLDMDCNILESEFQSSIEQLLWFVDQYLILTNVGDFTEETVNIIFNRDIIINESEVIGDCEKSVGILDDQTIRENHPWYSDDVEERLEKQKAEEQKAVEGYEGTFQTPPVKDVKENV